MSLPSFVPWLLRQGFRHLRSLETLLLNGNELSGWGDLMTCVSLSSLHFESNRFRSLKGIGALVNLSVRAPSLLACLCSHVGLRLSMLGRASMCCYLSISMFKSCKCACVRDFL